MNKDKISRKTILPLISAASVIRKEFLLTDLLILAKEKKIPPVKIYEALLQTYLFAGYPSALISLKLFGRIFPGYRNKTDIFKLDLKIRGEKTCRKIYGDKYDKLISNVFSFSPDLAEWLVVEGYGKVLSREMLSLKERELCIIAILSVLKYEDQLYSHIKGAYRTGNKISDIQQVFQSLELLGKKNYSVFGIKVLEKFNLSNYSQEAYS